MAIKCELCGNTEFVKEDGMFVCKGCNTKYSLEDAKKMMGEETVCVQGTVKVDQNDTIRNYLEMAKIAVESEDVAGVENYTTKILELDPNNYEAWLYKAKMTGWGSSLSNDKIKAAIVAVKKVISLTPDDEKSKVANDLMNCIVTQNFALIDIAKGIPGDARPLHNCMLQWITIVDSIPNLSVSSIKSQIELCKTMCDDSKKATLPRDRAIYGAYFGFNKEPYYITFAKKLAPKIQREEPDYIPPEKSGGCYVATAVYGSYDCPEVWTLRRYRDNTLAESIFGRAFIHTYYAISPTLVKWFGETQWFKNLFKGKLDRMVKNLNEQGVENTPYEDKSWK